MTRIALIATCLADTLFPDVARVTLTALRRLGHEAVYPCRTARHHPRVVHRPHRGQGEVVSQVVRADAARRHEPDIGERRRQCPDGRCPPELSAGRNLTVVRPNSRAAWTSVAVTAPGREAPRVPGSARQLRAKDRGTR